LRLWSALFSASAFAEGSSDACKRVFVDELVLSGVVKVLLLGSEATRVVLEPNAGGKSVVSEALSVEYMAQRFRATDVQTEMELKYWSEHWKKIDYSVRVGNVRVGVSVTRAMGFPTQAEFTMEDARRLLKKKLFGLLVARAGIDESCRFGVAVLHVWCQSKRIAALLRQHFEELALAEERRFLREGGDAAGSWPPATDNVVLLLTVAASAPEIFTDDLAWLQTA